MRYLKFIPPFTIAVVLLISCSTEMRLANNLQRHKNQIHVLCSFPEQIILSNSKVPFPESLEKEEESDFYDSIYYHSDYVQYIDDTIFLRKFRAATEKYFESIGFSYHKVEDLNEFLMSNGTKYLISFKQLELEERWTSYHDEEVIGNTLYEEDFWVNGISLNAWMDVAKVNDTVEIQRQTYQESILQDNVEGMFFQNQWNGEVHYQYRIDTLRVRDIGDLQTRSAHDFGYFIINFIINKEISDHLNYLEGLKPQNTWYYSPNSGRLIPEPNY